MNAEWLLTGKAGAQVRVVTAANVTPPAGVRPGRTEALFRLGSVIGTVEPDFFSDEPELVALVLSSLIRPENTWTLTFNLIAALRFSTGKVSHTAEIDIPAGGTVVMLAGCDGLAVDVRAEGTSTNAVADVFGSVTRADNTTSQPAQRTLSHTLPADSGVVRPIPRFARGYRIVADAPGAVGATFLDVLDSPAAGAVISSNGVTLTAFVPIPIGSEFYRITGAGPATLRTIWELQL